MLKRLFFCSWGNLKTFTWTKAYLELWETLERNTETDNDCRHTSMTVLKAELYTGLSSLYPTVYQASNSQFILILLWGIWSIVRLNEMPRISVKKFQWRQFEARQISSILGESVWHSLVTTAVWLDDSANAQKHCMRELEEKLPKVQASV